MIKKLAILLTFFFGVHGMIRAQYSMDFGLNLGASTYIGEIGEPGETDNIENPFPFYIIPRAARYNLGGFYRYNFNRNIAARFEMNWVRVAGADSLSKEPSRIGRNLSFRTDIFEFSLQGEYAFLVRNNISRRSKIDFRASAHAGMGYMIYYPKAQLNDRWRSLRSLATEGLENQYGTGSVIIPMGLGYSFTFQRQFRLGMDFTYRFTFTDYIDDISTDFASPDELPFIESAEFANRSAEAYARGDTDLPDPIYYSPGYKRGNPETNDGYFMLQIKASYFIPLTNSFDRNRNRRLYNKRGLRK
jgi:hypothetical protein